jgi:myo-inositol-1(or 4)-monophosphatase
MASPDIPVSTSGRAAIEVANEAVREAGEVITARFAGDKSISYKEGRSNVVTDVDLLAEERIIAVLRREYPDHGIMTEESDDIAGRSPYTWIIDPIDGTRNYAYGIPHFCVALALAREEEVVLGVIYDPMRGELFRAEKGCGAFLNDSPIAVSSRESLSVALVAFDLGYDPDIGQKMLKVAGALWPEVAAVRVMGSAALGLAYVACGRLDLYFHFSLYPWDLAAGIALIGEAGGAVTELEGQPVGIRSRTVVAANRTIHRDFIDRVTR